MLARVGDVAWEQLLRQGQVLLTSTVAELLAGSSLEVVETGRRPLRGVQGEWKLLEAVTPSSVGS